jgi:hypothetical protein
MATSQIQLANHPDPRAQAALKKSAKESLTRIGLDPTKLQITDQGLAGATGVSRRASINDSATLRRTVQAAGVLSAAL